MAELSDADAKSGRYPDVSHTFIIEIDRRGSQAQERLRWKWPQGQDSSTGVTGDTTTAVARGLLDFLDAHLRAHEPGGLAVTVDSSARALMGQCPRGYSVEVHHPALGGWHPLSAATPSETIPKNCRVHVSLNETFKAASPRQQNVTPSSGGSGGTAGVLPPVHPEQASNGTDGREMLALPWRRFDRDLGDEDGEGFQICGRRMVVGDVSNSSEGTGLFTWDGSVLLAKYLEHQAVAMRRDFGHQRSRRQTRPTATACDRAESNGGVINGTGGEPGGFGNKACPAVRVLELGCGTGLAGLAAAFSFGRRETGHRGSDIIAALSCPRQRSNTCGDENNGSVECASSPTVESGVEVLLTDLEYALENARSNIRRNASSLKALGNTVNAVELDWCRPLPDEFGGGDSFDLILAADVVWLDELVEPLVRTLERLTAGWPSCSGSSGRQLESPQAPVAAWSAPSAAAQELGVLGERAAAAHADGAAQKGPGAVVAGPPPVSPRLQRPGVGPRVLLAYQWRSQRTGDTLLEELEKAFLVREIQPEECHPEYLPSSNLCLFELARR